MYDKENIIIFLILIKEGHNMDPILAALIGAGAQKPKLKIAGETLSIGTVVSDIDGVIKKPAPKTQVTFDSYTSLATTNDEPILKKITDTKYMFFYKTPGTNNTYACILTLDGNNITYGTPFKLTNVLSIWGALVIDNGRAMVMYYNGTTLNGYIISFAGDVVISISSGQPLLNLAYQVSSPRIVLTPSGNVLCIAAVRPIQSQTYYKMTISKLQVTGTTISILGTTDTEMLGTTFVGQIGASIMDNDKVLLSYTFDTPSKTHIALYTGLGSSILTLVSSSYTIGLTYLDFHRLAKVSDNQALFSYYDRSSLSSYIRRVTIESNLTLTFSDEYKLSNGNRGASLFTIDKLDTDKFITCSRNSTDDPDFPDKFYCRVLMTDNNTITIGDRYVMNPTSAETFEWPNIVTISPTRVIAMYQPTNGGVTSLRNILATIGTGIPATGMTVTNSAVDYDGITKVGYISF
jgi:hypothetical protein